MNLKITTRLWLPTIALGSLLAALAVVASVRTTQQIEQGNQAQIELMQQLADANAWQGLTSANAVRTMVLALSTDAALAAGLKPEMEATSARISSLGQKLQASAQDAESKAGLAEVAQARQSYLDQRQQVQTAVTTGDAAQASRLLHEKMLPMHKAYQASQDSFVALQHRRAQVLREAIGEQRRATIWAMMVAAGLMVTGLALASALLARSISAPLRQLADVARNIGDGDLDALVPTGRGDEIGELQQSLAGMRDALRRIVGQVRESADSIRHASMEVATGNFDLSQRTEHTASKLQHSAGSLAQLTVNVRHSADSAAQANQLANSASVVARRGGEAVTQVVETMTQIHVASQRIADIIGTIDGIAFQTNILALNAAVEAARAGEQGRGFAVVAGEVRSLAQRSAEAAREIKGLISTSVEKVEAGTRLVHDAGSTMGEIVSSVQRVTDVLGEITAAASEQRDGIAQINQAIGGLDQMTQQNAALVEQSAAAAESLKAQAEHLAQAMQVFKLSHGGRTAVPVWRGDQAKATSGSTVSARSASAHTHTHTQTHTPTPTPGQACKAAAAASAARTPVCAAPRAVPSAAAQQAMSKASLSSAQAVAVAGTGGSPRNSGADDGDWESF